MTPPADSTAPPAALARDLARRFTLRVPRAFGRGYCIADRGFTDGAVVSADLRPVAAVRLLADHPTLECSDSTTGDAIAVDELRDLAAALAVEVHLPAGRSFLVNGRHCSGLVGSYESAARALGAGDQAALHAPVRYSTSGGVELTRAQVAARAELEREIEAAKGTP